MLSSFHFPQVQFEQKNRIVRKRETLSKTEIWSRSGPQLWGLGFGREPKDGTSTYPAHNVCPPLPRLSMPASEMITAGIKEPECLLVSHRGHRNIQMPGSHTQPWFSPGSHKSNGRPHRTAGSSMKPDEPRMVCPSIGPGGSFVLTLCSNIRSRRLLGIRYPHDTGLHVSNPPMAVRSYWYLEGLSVSAGHTGHHPLQRVTQPP